MNRNNNFDNRIYPSDSTIGWQQRDSTQPLLSVRQATRDILDCADDFIVMKQSVDTLYQLFCRITQVDASNLNGNKDIMLSSGKAISTSAAAHCLLEMKRTAVFLRGIHRAISKKTAENKSKPVQLLYAGTGPYGTLVIPLLTLLSKEEVSVDLIDINPESLNALQTLIEALRLEKYIGEVHCTDATSFTVGKEYDIVVSETMLACLKNEPQVAIMQNLIPQLSPDAIFIPEEISIDAALTNPKMEQERLFYYDGKQPPFRRIALGNLFTVNKQHLDTDRMQKTVTIPDDKDFPVLKLFTTVHVFGNEMLSENDSSITMPVIFYNLHRQPVRHVAFAYVQGEKPHIESRIVDTPDEDN
ncbi:MAG: hypothetical protein H6Q17_1331 [Bacteroidetes bacterium]|nr:hypothetical protein [Bacteroidota bacterium]